MRWFCKMLPEHHKQLIGNEKKNKSFFKPHLHRGDKIERKIDFHDSKNDGKIVKSKNPSKSMETKQIYDISEATKTTTEEDAVNHRVFVRCPLSNSESYGWWYDRSNVGKEIESCYNWYPSLSSESYGWWYDRAFSLRQSKCNHHVRDPMLLQTTEVIHWQDQKLFGLGHSSYANNT